MEKLNPSYIDSDEETLINLCQQHDLEAFNVLISRYEARVLNQANRYLRDYHAALDEAQEIFIKVFQKIKLFQGSSSFSTWLYRVTANHCLNVIQKQKRQNIKQHISFQDHQETGDEQYNQDNQHKLPDYEMEEKHLQAELLEALDQLPPNLRKIIVLRHYEDMSYDEIASLLEVPATTICSSLHRARQQLRKIIERKGGQPK